MATKGNPLVNSLPLLFICFTAVLGIYALGQFLEDNITRNRHLPILEISAEILPLERDNDLPADRLSVTIPTYFGAETATYVYRARNGETPVGLIFSPVQARGYNGIMELAVGIQYDGTLAGVRILQHRETPGPGRSGSPGQFTLDTRFQRPLPGQHLTGKLGSNNRRRRLRPHQRRHLQPTRPDPRRGTHPELLRGQPGNPLPRVKFGTPINFGIQFGTPMNFAIPTKSGTPINSTNSKTPCNPKFTSLPELRCFPN